MPWGWAHCSCVLLLWSGQEAVPSAEGWEGAAGVRPGEEDEEMDTSLELGCSFHWTSGWKENGVRQNTQSLNFSLVFWGSHSLAGKELVVFILLGPG